MGKRRHTKLVILLLYVCFGGLLYSDEAESVRKQIKHRPAVLGHTHPDGTLRPCVLLQVENNRIVLVTGDFVADGEYGKLYIRSWRGKVIEERLRFISSRDSRTMDGPILSGANIYFYELDLQAMPSHSVQNLRNVAIKESEVAKLEPHASLAVLESVLNKDQDPRLGGCTLVSNEFYHSPFAQSALDIGHCYIFPDGGGLSPISSVFKTDDDSENELKWAGLTLEHHAYESATRMATAKSLFSWINRGTVPDQSDTIRSPSLVSHAPRVIDIDIGSLGEDAWIATSERLFTPPAAASINRFELDQLIQYAEGCIGTAAVVLQDDNRNFYLCICDQMLPTLTPQSKLRLSEQTKLFLLTDIFKDDDHSKFLIDLPGLAFRKIALEKLAPTDIELLEAHSIKLNDSSNDLPADAYAIGPVGPIVSKYYTSPNIHLRLTIGKDFNPYSIPSLPKHFSTCPVYKSDGSNAFLGILGVKDEMRYFHPTSIILETFGNHNSGE
jgi:hypothetical protein